MTTIETQVAGQRVLLDERDAALFARTAWRIDSLGYLTATIDGKRVRFHRVALAAGKGQVVDHINRDKLDCRRCNLRLTDRAGNAQNAGPHAHNSSGFKGVYLCKQTGRWRAEIRAGKRCIKLGRFATPEEAARAYDQAAVQHHGEFALTNAKLGLLAGCDA